MENPVIADCDSVGISAEVLKDAMDAIEGRLAIDDPFLTTEVAPELLEFLRLLEMAYRVGEYQNTRLEAFLQEAKELPFEQR